MFTIGDKVVWSHLPTSPARGTIKAILPNGLYKVKWDHPDDNDRHDPRASTGIAHEDYIAGVL